MPCVWISLHFKLWNLTLNFTRIRVWSSVILSKYRSILSPTEHRVSTLMASELVEDQDRRDFKVLCVPEEVCVRWSHCDQPRPTRSSSRWVTCPHRNGQTLPNSVVGVHFHFWVLIFTLIFSANFCSNFQFVCGNFCRCKIPLSKREDLKGSVLRCVQQTGTRRGARSGDLVRRVLLQWPAVGLRTRVRLNLGSHEMYHKKGLLDSELIWRPF